MSLERKILSITRPTIPIDQMTMMDTDDPNQPANSTEKEFKKAGAIYPLIDINKYQFNTSEIVRFRLEETDFLPEVSITAVSSNGVFISKHFPKDGDPVSVFIRSKMDEFKPVRADFEITSVNSFPSTDSDGEVIQFTINGVLRIPGLFAEHCKAFNDKASFDTLIAVCKELQIGFASNDTSTADKMTWLCPFDTYHKFIKDVTLSSYKDDDSFFKSHIDHHYFLNFVNADNQFGDEVEIEAMLDTFQDQNDFFTGHKIEKFEGQLLLCNHKTLMGSSNYIMKYTLLNNAGQIVIDNGYRRYVQFYDNFFQEPKPEGKYQAHFVEPLNTKDTDGKILNKGRVKEPEIFKNTSKFKWMGTQMSLPKGNTHENYLYAQIHNWQNIQGLEKLILHVDLGKPNFNLYRGQRIPVVILNTGSTMRQKMTADPEQSDSHKISYDKFLSGYYMIHGIKYDWTLIDGFHQSLMLTRREWPIPVQSTGYMAQG